MWLKRSASALSISVFFLAGIVFWGGFNWSMEITNTESFCISCHEMEQNVYQEYKKSIHYANSTGVRATCPDCHVPLQWGYKVARKLRATNELYHWAIGSIDTREKFNARRGQLAAHVWKDMRQTDSRECRNCHDYGHMLFKQQSFITGKTHQVGNDLGWTCIDCHQGIAHTLPESFDKEIQIDALHNDIEQQGIACFECHRDVYAPAQGEEW